MLANSNVQISGKSSNTFGYIEHDITELDLSIVRDIVLEGDSNGNVLYIIRNAINSDVCSKLLEAFDLSLLLQGNMRGEDGYVRTNQIGATQFHKNCNDPLVSAHPTPLMPDVLGVPHSPTTDVAALRCNTGSSGRLPLGPGPTIRTDAARCILPSMIGRSARPARFAPGCMVS